MNTTENNATPSDPNKQDTDFVVGAKRMPDGSWDYSKAATWSGLRSDSTMEKAANFQQDVQGIMSHIDRLDALLEPKEFKPGWPTLEQHLGANITGITAFIRVLSKIKPDEYAAILRKVNNLEARSQQALDKCKVEQMKRTQGMGGAYVPEGVFYWLEQEGPTVFRSLKELKNIVTA